jgi:cholesterol transport system auxiliary component
MKRLCLLVVTVLSAACVTSHRPPTQYDLGEFAASQSRVLTATLIVREVIPPSWLRTRNIFYRLEYATPSHPQRYATSQWLATPGELVTLRLREAVASANAGFTLWTSNSEGAYVLQTTLEEFIQVFPSPADSHCIVQMRASLWRSGDQILAQREFRIEVPASDPTASGGAECLGSAVNRETADIIEWLREELASGDSTDQRRP